MVVVVVVEKEEEEDVRRKKKKKESATVINSWKNIPFVWHYCRLVSPIHCRHCCCYCCSNFCIIVYADAKKGERESLWHGAELKHKAQSWANGSNTNGASYKFSAWCKWVYPNHVCFYAWLYRYGAHTDIHTFFDALHHARCEYYIKYESPTSKTMTANRNSNSSNNNNKISTRLNAIYSLPFT